MPLTIDSARFGRLDIDPDTVIEFPAGLIGLGGSRYALVSQDDDGPFAWLHSLDDPELAIPVTNPWRFFSDYEVLLSDEEAQRVGITDPAEADVWVTVVAGPSVEDCRANLRAPILVAAGRGHQVINEADHAPVRMPLFSAHAHDQAA